ncbi:GH22873 [Drosophila grimshawi]|uniref:GH22873 n=1 Tax=Drosophila grimshawi TaxID=7222 RepID=B4JVU4_DROGR|nr:GH22873 [Drosophila grimshawi]
MWVLDTAAHKCSRSMGQVRKQDQVQGQRQGQRQRQGQGQGQGQESSLRANQQAAELQTASCK